MATVLANTPRRRDGHLPIHQRILQSATTPLSLGLEKPLGLRSKGCIKEQWERHKSVTGPDRTDTKGRLPGRINQRQSVRTDTKRRYKRRNRIKIMFGRPKNWRRVATRYDRCPEVFLLAIALAASMVDVHEC